MRKLRHDDFRDYDLKLRTKKFALQIIRLNEKLPLSTVAQVVGKQILRSGTSVGAHYREASRSRSKAEFISKIEVGLQELEETVYWVGLLIESNIVQEGQLHSFLKESSELNAIFTACVRKAKRKG